MPDWYRRRCREAEGAAPTRTASTASAAVARRIARLAFVCADFVFRVSRCLFSPNFGILMFNVTPCDMHDHESEIRMQKG